MCLSNVEDWKPYLRPIVIFILENMFTTGIFNAQKNQGCFATEFCFFV